MTRTQVLGLQFRWVLPLRPHHLAPLAPHTSAHPHFIQHGPSVVHGQVDAMEKHEFYEDYILDTDAAGTTPEDRGTYDDFMEVWTGLHRHVSLREVIQQQNWGLEFGFVVTRA